MRTSRPVRHLRPHGGNGRSSVKNPGLEAEYHEADIAFHQCLLRATGNAMLVALVSKIHNAMLEARYPTARPQLRSKRTLPEHKKILTAIANGNSKSARSAMKAHLDSVEVFLKEYAAEQEALVS